MIESETKKKMAGKKSSIDNAGQETGHCWSTENDGTRFFNKEYYISAEDESELDFIPFTCWPFYWIASPWNTFWIRCECTLHALSLSITLYPRRAASCYLCVSCPSSKANANRFLIFLVVNNTVVCVCVSFVCQHVFFFLPPFTPIHIPQLSCAYLNLYISGVCV